MKFLRFLKLYLSLVTVFSLYSCTYEPVGSSVVIPLVTPIPTGSFKVDFDNNSFITTNNTAVIKEGKITINAVKGTQLESFSVIITGTVTGTYLTNTNIFSYSSGLDQPVFTSINPSITSSNTGHIAITTIDYVNHTLSGNFVFTGYNSNGTTILMKDFTNGVFEKIPFTTN